MTDNERVASLRSLAEHCAAPHGLSVEQVSLTPAGRRRVLTFVVDTDISDLDPNDTTSTIDPVDLDAVAEVTRELSARLDESDLMGDTAFTLEVSSPGVGRRLERYEEFRRNVGRKARLRYSAAADANAAGPAKLTEVTGRLVSVTPASLVLTPDPMRSSPGAKPKPVPDVTVGLADIAHANVEVDFASHEEDH